jgi:hypothetical protein
VITLWRFRIWALRFAVVFLVSIFFIVSSHAAAENANGSRKVAADFRLLER